VGRHSEPGTGAPAPDRGFWVRAGVVGLAVVLAGTYLLVRRGDDEDGISNVHTRSTVSATVAPSTPPGSATTGSPTPSAASTSSARASGAERAPTLAFRVLRDSYITVRVPGGTTLVSKTFHKGQERTFDRAVLQVVNGRPSAVRFTVNGKPRDPGRADRVETFTVRRRADAG